MKWQTKRGIDKTREGGGGRVMRLGYIQGVSILSNRNKEEGKRIIIMKLSE